MSRCTRWFLPLLLLPLPTASPFFLVLFLISLTMHAKPWSVHPPPSLSFLTFFALVSIASSFFLLSSSPPATGSLFRQILRSPHPGQKTFPHSPTPSMLLCPQICLVPPSSELRTVVGAISPMGLFSSPSTYLIGNF